MARFHGPVQVVNDSGTVQGQITAAGGVSGTTGAFSSTLAVTGATTLTGAVALGSTIAGLTRVVEPHTAGDTLGVAESGSVHTNLGAAGAITLVLPAAVPGLEFIFHVQAAQELRIDPNGTETLSVSKGGAQEAAGKYASANEDLEYLHLRCAKAGRWECIDVAGTWTVEG